MPVRIRLAQRGKKKNRTFRVIVADSRSPRDGKFIKAVAWLDKGAQPSERAQKILEISGAWAQWRSSKGEVISIPQAPKEKIKSSSKANKKKLEENSDETSSEEATSEGSADEGTSKEEE